MTREEMEKSADELTAKGLFRRVPTTDGSIHLVPGPEWPDVTYKDARTGVVITREEAFRRAHR